MKSSSHRFVAGITVATLLAVVSGCSAGSPSANGEASAFASSTSAATTAHLWVATGDMVAARMIHTATPLADGTVLVAGGLGRGLLGPALASAELFDPDSGTWTASGAMLEARRGHSATLLKDGRVLVAGGYDLGKQLTSAELYDPSTGSWNPTAPMAEARTDHSATLLDDG
ncbi:MAG: kelch repeat-containing protein, partial [Chloroflexota bacterium]